jgi:serine/threonine protein kinase
MELYQGSVQDYVEAHPTHRRRPDLLKLLFNHSLRALMFIAHKGVIHRDVKPANILYSGSELPNFRFVLSDSGLSKEQKLANSSKMGTRMYMAPEILHRGPQSHKSDVSSLGINLLAVRAARGFDQANIANSLQLSSAVANGI